MAIEAPISKGTKLRLLTYALVLVGLAGWFGYDGFLNQEFMAEHTSEAGVAEFALTFNQKSPPFFLAAALLFALRLFVVRKRRIVAEESELIIHENLRIPYDAIQEIDRTHYKAKGVFALAYDSPGGERLRHKVDSRDYDNMTAILDHLVQQIS